MLVVVVVVVAVAVVVFAVVVVFVAVAVDVVVVDDDVSNVVFPYAGFQSESDLFSPIDNLETLALLSSPSV